MLKKILVIACAASCATSGINANQEIAPVVSEQRIEQEQQEFVKQGQELVRQLRQQGYTDEKIAQLLIEAAENDDLGISTSRKVYYMLLGAAGALAVVGGGFALYKYVIEPKLRQRAQQAEAARIAAAQAEEARLDPNNAPEAVARALDRMMEARLAREAAADRLEAGFQAEEARREADHLVEEARVAFREMLAEIDRIPARDAVLVEETREALAALDRREAADRQAEAQPAAVAGDENLPD